MRGQKGGLRDWIMTNKIISLNIKKKKETNETNLKQKNEQEAELRKISKVLDNRKKESNVPLKARRVIDLKVMKKGADIDPSILNNVIVTTEANVNQIEYEETAKEVMVITTDEVKIIQNNIKKGIEQTKTEAVIIKKVNTIIEKAKQEINAIKEEVKKVEKTIINEYDTKRLAGHEYQLLEIQIRIENLKRRYSILLGNTDFINFDELNDEALLEEISNYKFVVDRNELVTDLAKDCKKELDKMSMIMEIYDKKTSTDHEAEKKKRELEQRDEEFVVHKKGVISVEKVNNQIKENLAHQQEFIRTLEYKINDAEDSYNEGLHILSLNVMGYNLSKISFLLYAMKHKKIGLAVAGLLFDNLTRVMRNSFVEKQKRMAYLEYKQLNKELFNQKDSLGYISEILNDSLRQVEKLKEEFGYKFKKYQGVLPEYDLISKKLDLIISQLRTKNEQVKKSEEQVEKKYEKNKVKIKRMEGA